MCSLMMQSLALCGGVEYLSTLLALVSIVPYTPKQRLILKQMRRTLWRAGGKWGQICTKFEVKQRKSTESTRETPGETASHLVSSLTNL